MDHRGPDADASASKDNPAAYQTQQKTSTAVTTAHGAELHRSDQGDVAEVELYQNCQKLCPLFEDIFQFCDVVDGNDWNCEAALSTLMSLRNFLSELCLTDLAYAARSAVGAGFAERAAKFFHRAVVEGGASFGVDLLQSKKDMLLPVVLHYLAGVESEFRLCVARTSFFADGIRCLDSLSRKQRHEAGGCYAVLAVIAECCKDHEAAALLKEKDIAHSLVPFLDVTMNRDTRLVTFYLLASVASDAQLSYLALDHDLLEYSLRRAKQALESKKPLGRNGWEVDEITDCLSRLSRLDFNKRLIVAKDGAIELLKRVLHEGGQEAVDGVLALLEHLVQDAANAGMFQRDKELVMFLSVLEHKDSNNKRADTVNKILIRIKEADSEGEDGVEEASALADVLANQSNALIILNVGKVEFILNRLADLICGRGAQGCQITEVKIAKALRELANHESCRREIMARGGLRLLQKLLQRDDDHDCLEPLNLLLVLASCKEYSILIQAAAGLMESVQKLTRHDNQQVRQAAVQLVDVIMATPTESIIMSSPP